MEKIWNGFKEERISKRYIVICLTWNNKLMVYNHVGRTPLPLFCSSRTGGWNETRHVPLSGTKNRLSEVKPWTNQPKVSQAPSQPRHQPCQWLRLSTAHPSHLNTRACLDPQLHLGCARTSALSTVDPPIQLSRPLPKIYPALTIQWVTDDSELVAPRQSTTS